MAVFHSGKATKPSSLGRPTAQQRSKLMELSKLVAELGYSLHVIDSERAEDDISVSMYDELLRSCEEKGQSTMTVITLPVRRWDFEPRFAEFLEVLSNHDLGGLCIVAGNPAYLSEDEARIPAGRALLRAVERARAKLSDALILVGTENVVRPAVEACRRFRAIPFTLLNGNSVSEIRWITAETGMPAAIYAPFHIGERLDEASEEVLTSYAMRRRGVREMISELDIRELIRRVALIGSASRIKAEIAKLAEAGARYIVGLPVGDVEVQIRQLIRSALGVDDASTR